MRSIAATLVAAAVTISAAPTKAQQPYTMDDLRAASQQESWQEILEHALDVRPSKRRGPWKQYLETAAIGHVTAVRDTGDLDRALKEAEELIVKHPLLKRSKKYMDTRARVGLEAFEQCYRDRSAGFSCSERLETFVNVDPTNDNLAFEAGKLSRLRGSDYVAARLFAIAFKKASRRSGCDDAQVKLAVKSVLSNARHEPTRAAARKVAFDYCWDQLQADLLDNFLNAGTGYLTATCPDLKSRKALSEFQLALCEDTK